VQVDDSADFASPVVNRYVTVSAYTVYPALPDGAYVWRVRARDAALNWSGWSSVRGFTVDTTPPSAPGLNLPADGVSTSDLTPWLDWQDPTGSPAAYQVQVDDSADFASPVVNRYVTLSSYTVYPGLPEGSYSWRVQARDAALNWSGWSSARSLVIDTTPPSVPGLSNPADGASTNDTTPWLDWPDSTGSPAAYQVQVDDSADFSSPVLDRYPYGSSYTVSPALTEGVYSWRVRARDAARNWSGWSAVRSFTVDTTPPSVPGLGSPADGSSTSDPTPWFNWDDATGSPVQYQLQLDDSADFSSPLVLDQSPYGSGYTPTTPLAPGAYFWRVRARDAAVNWSPWSPVWSFTITGSAAAQGSPVAAAVPPGARLEAALRQ
jgi:hypothetical protein